MHTYIHTYIHNAYIFKLSNLNRTNTLTDPNPFKYTYMKAYVYAIYNIDNLTECLCPPLPYQGVDEPSNAATLKDKFPAIHALRSEVVSFAQKFPTVGF